MRLKFYIKSILDSISSEDPNLIKFIEYEFTCYESRLVFFDLPITTIQGIRAYTKFRRFLLKDGFIMMQESVYSKLAQNQLAANALISHIRKNSPDEGLIQILTVTENSIQIWK